MQFRRSWTQLSKGQTFDPSKLLLQSNPERMADVRIRPMYRGDLLIEVIQRLLLVALNVRSMHCQLDLPEAPIFKTYWYFQSVPLIEV